MMLTMIFSCSNHTAVTVSGFSTQPANTTYSDGSSQTTETKITRSGLLLVVGARLKTAQTLHWVKNHYQICLTEIAKITYATEERHLSQNPICRGLIKFEQQDNAVSGLMQA